MRAQIDISIDNIKKWVSDFVLQQPSLYAYVERLVDSISMRTISINIYSERLLSNQEDYCKYLNEIALPVVVNIQNKLIEEGYNVSSAEDIYIADFTESQRVMIGLRCSSLPVMKLDNTESLKNDIGMKAGYRDSEGNMLWK
jgi:hypothetical protein